MSAAKAIYDKAVIDAWQARRADYFRRFNRGMWITVILGLPGLWLLATLTDWGWIVAGVGLMLANTLSTLWARDRYLRCPHCEKRLRSASASPLLPQPAYCRHCLYWLESPYTSDAPAA